MTVDNRRELSPTEIIELRLQCLFSDLLLYQHKDEIVEWREALDFKLHAFRHIETRLRQIATTAPSVLEQEMKQPGVLLPSTSSVIENARLNLEFFFYLGTAAFDVLAKLTKAFYPKNQKSFPNDKRLYFTNIVRILTTFGIDKEFGQLLSTHAPWITSIYNNRNTLAHSASAFIGFDENYNMIFEKRNPDQTQLWREHKNENIVAYLDEIRLNLNTFLEQYLVHFRKRVTETERTRLFMKALESG